MIRDKINLFSEHWTKTNYSHQWALDENEPKRMDSRFAFRRPRTSASEVSTYAFPENIRSKTTLELWVFKVFQDILYDFRRLFDHYKSFFKQSTKVVGAGRENLKRCLQQALGMTTRNVCCHFLDC